MTFRFSSVRLLVCFLTLIFACSSASAQAASTQVTGTVAYRERMALPSDAVINIQLLDTSVADVAAQTVAEALINAEGRQVPVPFTLSYDPAQIDPAHRYSVRATIRSGDGMLMFSSTQAYPALTHGAPSKVNLILHTVGHGAKPAASAKKAPAAPEAANTAMQPASETPPTTEAAPSAPVTDKSATETESKPGQTEHAAMPSSTPSESASAPPPDSAPVPAASAESTPSEAAPEAESSSRESKPAQSQPAAPAASTPSPEANSLTPEPSLPEAPSTSKHAEIAAAAPDSAEAAADSAPARPAPNKGLTPLADTQWKLVQLAGQDIVITPPQKPVTLAFSPEGKRIAGSAGCNSYIGSFTDDHGRLHLNPGNMTMMACVDPAGSRERKFVAMLRSADGYRISGEFLLLTSSGKTVAKFRNNQE